MRFHVLQGLNQSSYQVHLDPSSVKRFKKCQKKGATAICKPLQLSSSMVPHKKPFRREQINLGHLRSGDDQQLWPGDAMESDPRRTDSLAKASLDSLAQKGGYGGLG